MPMTTGSFSFRSVRERGRAPPPPPSPPPRAEVAGRRKERGR